jgi:hypothetical protein
VTAEPALRQQGAVGRRGDGHLVGDTQRVQDLLPQQFRVRLLRGGDEGRSQDGVPEVRVLPPLTRGARRELVEPGECRAERLSAEGGVRVAAEAPHSWRQAGQAGGVFHQVPQGDAGRGHCRQPPLHRIVHVEQSGRSHTHQGRSGEHLRE